MSRLVGAYLCPRGAWLVEAKARRGGMEVVHTFDRPASLTSATEAASHLVRCLADADIRRADVCLVMRGFELVHHTLSLPPARENMLTPIIEREMRRLEPQLADPAIGWAPLPDDQQAPTDQPPQRHLLVAAIPRATAALVEAELEAAGHTLRHLTALPAAFQRLAEDFDPKLATTALLAALPDGLFLGLFLGGGLRIAIEPPLQEHDAPDGTAMAEEAELGATYVRQQFRGAQVERAVIAGPAHLWQDTQSILTERLGVPVDRFDLNGLSSAALAALGALLDARAPAPLALAGRIANRKRDQARATLRQTSFAALAATVIVAAWAVFQALEARRADDQLRDARRRLEVVSAGVGSIRQTADQRRLVRDATALLRLTARDRAALQSALASISGRIVGPVRLDSLHLDRASNGWLAILAGSTAGTSSGSAVQALHDFYRDLPRRLVTEELTLQAMAYADTLVAGGEGSMIRFRLSFVIPAAPERQD